MRAGQSGSGFVHAASVLPKFLTASAASLLLAKQVLKPLSPGALHAASVEYAMQQNVSGCELQTSKKQAVPTQADGACDGVPAAVPLALAVRSVPVGNHGDNLNFVTVPA